MDVDLPKSEREVFYCALILCNCHACDNAQRYDGFSCVQPSGLVIERVSFLFLSGCGQY